MDFDDEKLRYATILHNAARGSDNTEMMTRLTEYLDRNYNNKSEEVLLKNRKK